MHRSLLIVTSFLSFACFARDIEVCESCEYRSITAAVQAAENGDRVIVHQGNFRESNIYIDKSISLIGKNYPVIDGGGKDEEVIVIEADHVSVSGFQIQNIRPSHLKDLAGIRVRRKKHFRIEKNRLYNTMFGIYLERSSHGIVRGNELMGEATEESSSGNGIHAWYCKDLRIDDNLVIKHRDGIYFEFVTESVINRNRCEQNLRYGLHFMFSNYDTYQDNIFTTNGAGVAVMFSKEIEMYRNVFRDNWGGASYGLLLKEIYDAEIKDNIFDRNTIAIRVEGSTRVSYSSNDFINNGWALKIAGGCYENHISSNNFIANSFDLAMDQTNNNNILEGNFWADYSGYDLDRDGTGDIPHRPVKLFNFIVLNTPESVILLRSLFIDLINFSEKVSPIFTPKNVVDQRPRMTRITRKS